MGVRAAMTAVAALFFASVSAVPPVTQPPQPNPTIARATAPAAAPHRAGFTAALISRETSMIVTLTWSDGELRSFQTLDTWMDRCLYKIAHAGWPDASNPIGEYGVGDH